MEPPLKAVAILLSTKASKVQGRVTFTQTDGTMHVHGKFPAWLPAITVSTSTSSAYGRRRLGSGWPLQPDPRNACWDRHAPRHIGDLGNITANANGKATVDLDDPSLSFYGPTSIIGRGVVVHEKPTISRRADRQAGGRVAVGIIVVAQP